MSEQCLFADRESVRSWLSKHCQCDTWICLLFEKGKKPRFRLRRHWRKHFVLEGSMGKYNALMIRLIGNTFPSAEPIGNGRKRTKLW